MVEGTSDADLGSQLMAIARNPALRDAVYGRIGEYCHHCRNRLNSLKLSLYLAKQQASPELFDRWSGLDRHYGELERKVEHVQRLCRPMTLARVRINLELLINDRRSSWSDLWSARHDSLRFIPPREPLVAVLDVDRIAHALDAVVAWRAEQGGPDATACLSWWLEAGQARLAWEESGASPTAPQSDRGWSLPWLTRVIAEHAGRAEVADRSGWRLDLSWPAAPPDR